MRHLLIVAGNGEGLVAESEVAGDSHAILAGHGYDGATVDFLRSIQALEHTTEPKRIEEVRTMMDIVDRRAGQVSARADVDSRSSSSSGSGALLAVRR